MCAVGANRCAILRFGKQAGQLGREWWKVGTKWSCKLASKGQECAGNQAMSIRCSHCEWHSAISVGKKIGSSNGKSSRRSANSGDGKSSRSVSSSGKSTQRKYERWLLHPHLHQRQLNPRRKKAERRRRIDGDAKRFLHVCFIRGNAKK